MVWAHYQYLIRCFIIFALFAIGTGNSQSFKDLKKAAKKVSSKLVISEKNNLSFSEEDASKALKETLEKGINKGVELLSLKNGFFKNPNVKIPFPPEAKSIFERLKKIGLGKELDKVVLSINRAAEDAVISSKPIFLKAVKKMNIQDAITIIGGGEHAGTNYLSSKTRNDLVIEFSPNIEKSLKKVNATKHWNVIMTSYNKIPFVKKINPNLKIYVTEQAVDGLFYILAKEEKDIRNNPRKRNSEILKKVFGR